MDTGSPWDRCKSGFKIRGVRCRFIYLLEFPKPISFVTLTITSDPAQIWCENNLFWMKPVITVGYNSTESQIGNGDAQSDWSPALFLLAFPAF